MKKVIIILYLMLVIVGQIFAQNQKHVDVPYNDFLNLKKECCIYHVFDFECVKDSVIPYFLYEYTTFYYENWSGVMIAIPKIDDKIKYHKDAIRGDVLKNFYDILFDRDLLLANYNLYVYYLSLDQLTNVNDSGNIMLLTTDTGDEYYDWMEKDDAVAFVYYYENGEWKYYDTVATEGSSKFKAIDFAEELLEKRFECK